MAKYFTSWSHSRRADWEKCGFYAQAKHLDKIPEPSNQYMERGAAIGKMCEDYVKGQLLELPEELEHFGPEFEELRAAYRKDKGRRTIWVEEMWGFDRDWNPCHWKDWDNCVLRVKMDLARLIQPNHLLVVDYKTGKYRPYDVHVYVSQLRLYAAGAFARFTDIDTVSARLVYLDFGITYPEGDAMVFTRDQAKALRKEEDDRTAPMLADRRFEKRPGDHCRFCYLRKDGPIGRCTY